MREQLINAFNWSHQQTHAIVKDIPCERWAEMPYEGAKHAAWTVTHFCLADGFAAALASADPAERAGTADVPPRGGVPIAWADVASGQTSPQADRSIYPTKEAILDEFDRINKVVVDRYRALDDAILAEPLPIEAARDRWPTIGDALTFLLAQHDTYHLGQLQQWRRAIGFGPHA